MKSYFNNQNLFIIIWKWRIHLMIVGIATIIVAVIFSSPFFITPLYESQARVYPTNTVSYSEESESEQMLEIFNSTDIKRQVINNFDLANRYEIEKDDPYFETKILKKFDDRISSKKTEYESIELRVLDADPQVACNIVDSMIVLYNHKVQIIHKEKYKEQAFSYANDLKRKQIAIDSLTRKMDVLRKGYGMLDYGIQTQQLTQGYTDALARKAGPTAVRDIQERLDKLSEVGGEFHLYEGELDALETQRDTIARRLDKALNLVNKEETYTMVIEEPFPADKKSYPTRWLIVLLSLIATEFLALITILGIEGNQSSKQ